MMSSSFGLLVIHIGRSLPILFVLHWYEINIYEEEFMQWWFSTGKKFNRGKNKNSERDCAISSKSPWKWKKQLVAILNRSKYATFYTRLSRKLNTDCRLSCQWILFKLIRFMYSSSTRGIWKNISRFSISTCPFYFMLYRTCTPPWKKKKKKKEKKGSRIYRSIIILSIHASLYKINLL